MLCKVCVCLLRGGRGEVWTGKLDSTYQHHNTTTTLRHSREAGCTICTGLTKLIRHDIDLLEDQSFLIHASLRKLTDGARPDESNYRLDFDLEKKYTRTFLLKQIKSSDCPPRILRSLSTSSDEVFEVACDWIRGCSCADFWNHTGDKWYPKRLLDLQELRSVSGLRHLDFSEPFPTHGDLAHCKVRLVESSTFPIQEKDNNRYVTLSHCWGRPKSTQGQLKLTLKTEARFKEIGIGLQELSKTFREAVLFACRLEHVGYIWIDSLCIRQAITGPGLDPKDSQSDWLEQSGVMGKVYQRSYLNISATAAVDGDGGLFFPRRPEHLWEDEINIYSPSMHSATSLGTGKGSQKLTRCKLIDPNFWDELVEKAPVNQRGWVLQERLLAPRVLHFCHNQIAWECGGFQDAEGDPGMTSTWKLKSDDIVDERRLKSLTREDGLALRELRLNGYPDPDKHMEDLYVYEVWKRVVELYSQTRLSFSSDKLIALSGIARLFHEDTKCDYVAGLWRNHLESQLLWQVREVYEKGNFENPALRDNKRAPSFSWASIDFHHGIIYGEATDYREDRTEELLFEVKDYATIPADLDNPFGSIKEGWIKIETRYLRLIKLCKLGPQHRVPYSWRFKEDSSNQPLENYNLYLDAPESDIDIFKSNSELYCMPAAYGERTVPKSSRYLICLLLQRENNAMASFLDDGASLRVFRRIGLAKLSNCMDEKSQKILKETEVNELIYLV